MLSPLSCWQGSLLCCLLPVWGSWTFAMGVMVACGFMVLEDKRLSTPGMLWARGTEWGSWSSASSHWSVSFVRAGLFLFALPASRIWMDAKTAQYSLLIGLSPHSYWPGCLPSYSPTCALLTASQPGGNSSLRLCKPSGHQLCGLPREILEAGKIIW